MAGCGRQEGDGIRLIAGKASRTSRSRHGLIPGAASASVRLLNDRRHEHRLVAGSDRRPGFTACLHCGRRSCCRAAGRAAHHTERRAITPRQSPDWQSRTRTGHPRICHSKDTLYRSLSVPAQHNPDFTRLSWGTALARQTLIGRLGTKGHFAACSIFRIPEPAVRGSVISLSLLPQAACSCPTLISDSAGMPSPSCSRQIILSVSERLRFSTSCTRLRLPMKGMRSRGCSPF